MAIVKINSSLVNWSVSFLVGSLFTLLFFVERSDFLSLITLVVIAFTAYYLLASRGNSSFFYTGLVIRLIVFFAIPNLSDDYFRFLWDGQLLAEGISPFSKLPKELYASLLNSTQDAEYIKSLYLGMNSAAYYSVYPPITQWLFYLAALPSSVYLGVLLLKLPILLAELGVFWILKKILLRYSLPINKLSWYWLNPLVMIELVGNCHYEGLMLFFFLVALYQTARFKTVDGAFYMAFSVLSKLFSFMFLPLLILKSGVKRGGAILLLVFFLVVLCYLPFLSIEELQNTFVSYRLYFQRFEFNGGVYRLAREIGFYLVGYNPIKVLGPLLALISLVTILLISFVYRFRNRLSMFTGFLLIAFVHLVFSPIVHPWYLTVLVGFSVVSTYRFAIVWSATIYLSYFAYGMETVEENSFLIATEYLIVFLFFLREANRHFTWRKFKSAFIAT